MFRQVFKTNQVRSRRSRGGGFSSLLIASLLAAGGVLWLKPEGRLVQGETVVVDGDSLRIGETAIRLKGIDAPELRQSCRRDGRTYACGAVARAALADLVRPAVPRCRVTGRDRYGRSLARCAVGREDIGASLVRRGFAVAYGDYEREEAEARAGPLGLWAGEFDRPEDWRRAQRF
jgi:endonuclease YncB( thermonuclease family)